MYKKISYLLLFLIIFVIGFFVYFNNQKLKKETTDSKDAKMLTEEERIQVIFSREL